MVFCLMDKGKTPEKEIQAKQNQMLKEGKAYAICHENDSIEKKEQALQDRSIMSVIELGALPEKNAHYYVVGVTQPQNQHITWGNLLE